MHAEFYEMSKETAGILTATQKNGGKIIAVGTTSARTLESYLYLRMSSHLADENMRRLPWGVVAELKSTSEAS